MSSSSQSSLSSKRNKSSSIPIPVRTHSSPELDDRREVEKLENETRLYEWRATCMYHRLVNGMIRQRRGPPGLRSVKNVAMTTRRRPRDDDGTDATLGSSTSSDDWFLDDSYETKQYQVYHHPHQPPSITQAREITSIIGHQATRSCPSLSNINDIVEGHHHDHHDDYDDEEDDGIMFDMEL